MKPKFADCRKASIRLSRRGDGPLRPFITKMAAGSARPARWCGSEQLCPSTRCGVSGVNRIGPLSGIAARQWSRVENSNEQLIDYRPRRWWRGDCRRAFAGYQAMDNRRSAEVLTRTTRTVRTPRQFAPKSTSRANNDRNA
jgi:hypothetical protein